MYTKAIFIFMTGDFLEIYRPGNLLCMFRITKTLVFEGRLSGNIQKYLVQRFPK